jgi:hypothetical protein
VQDAREHRRLSQLLPNHNNCAQAAAARVATVAAEAKRYNIRVRVRVRVRVSWSRPRVPSASHLNPFSAALALTLTSP